MDLINDVLLANDKKDLEQCLNTIKKMYSRQKFWISNLQKENKELRDEHFKDRKLYEMEQQLNRMQRDYWRGFPITEAEEKKINAWKRKHDEEVHDYTPEERMKAEGCCGGRYRYLFIPTSIGVYGKIICHCGAEFEFQEIM